MFPRLAAAAIFAALLTAYTAPADAAELAAPGWGDFIKPWWDLAVQGLAAGAIALVAAAAKRWFNIDLEERHRRTLHLALTTGADAAWSKLMQWTGQGLSQTEIRDRLVAETISHGLAGASDAVSAFGLDAQDPRLVNLALAKLKQTAPQGATADLLLPSAAALAA
jgi:hypothetical protein